MSNATSEKKEATIRRIQNTIKTFDGIFDPTNEADSRLMAAAIWDKLHRMKQLNIY